MDRRGGATNNAQNFVMSTDGRTILPPNDERTSDPIKKMSTLASNMENIALSFK
jgi:hypothetical protein